jgi:hypothetical protein
MEKSVNMVKIGGKNYKCKKLSKILLIFTNFFTDLC